MDYSHLSEVCKNWAQVAAVAAGGIWFVRQALFRGEHWVNLSLALSTRRWPKDADTDYLAATLAIKKEASGGKLQLNDIVFRVVSAAGGSEVTARPGIRALGCDDRTGGPPARFDAPEGRFLNLLPGESTTFAVCMVVPAASPSRVDVVVVGGGAAAPSHMGQWRASSIALPER
jgi:hypothetical protein